MSAVLQYALCFFAGLSVYVFLLLSDKLAPQQLSWGDCTSWSGLWHHFRRGGTAATVACTHSSLVEIEIEVEMFP